MLTKPNFKPGIVKTETGLANEGGFSDGNRVRFWQGRAEPIGGWQLATIQTFSGTARGAKSWTTLSGKPVYAFGTSSHLYGVIGGAVRDITPALIETTEEDIFSTTNGSATVTVYVEDHLLDTGDTVVFSNHQSTVGGLTIEGTYTVASVLTADRFTITHGSNASSTETDAGGFVDIRIPLPAGLADSDPSGYGTGTYGTGTYGASTTAGDARVWFVDAWGENGVFVPSGRGLFEWQPETSYAELAANGDFDGSIDGWAGGTGWAYDAANERVQKTAGTASNLSQNVEGVLEGGRTYRVEFTVGGRTAGQIKFRVNAGATPAVIDVGAASSAITKNGTYSRLFQCPADPVDIVLEADASFDGWIDDVSYTLESAAYRILSAPPQIDAMFVDPNGVVVALGVTGSNGIYNPAGLRTSDLGNNKSWVPGSGSIATDEILRGGGAAMTGIATRQQDLVWGNAGVFSLQWAGNEGQAFTINLLGTGCGLNSRQAVAESNGFVMWMANNDQFYIFRGVGATNLGVPEVMPCPVREYVFDTMDKDQIVKVHAGINTKFSEFWLWYPDTRDGEECSRAVAYSWVEGTWSLHEMDRTAWIPAGVLDEPLAMRSDGRIFAHESGYTANGEILNAYLETSDFDFQDGDKLLAVMRIVPDIRDQVGEIRYTLKTKLYPSQASFLETPTVPELASATTEELYLRAHARQARVRIDWASAGSFGRMGALRLDLAPTPMRR